MLWRIRSGKPRTIAGSVWRSAAAMRRRAVTLAELILYISVTMGVLVFTISLIQQEAGRQSRSVAAGDVQMAVEAAQLYVSARYDAIVDQLFDAALPGNEMFARISLDELYDAGFLPRPLEPGQSVLSREFGQDLALYVRAVLRSDPQNDTATANQVDLDGNGMVDNDLRDAIYAEGGGGPPPAAPADTVLNDELDLEALLIADGTIAQNRGTLLRIAAQSEQAAAGAIQLLDGGGTTARLVARGVAGAWELDVSELSTLAQADPNLSLGNENLIAMDFDRTDPPMNEGEGFLAALIAVPNFGVMTSYGNPREANRESGLRLCVDLLGQPQEYADCLADQQNQMMSALVMRAADEDGDGIPDRFPRFEAVFDIEMADANLVRRTDAAHTIRMTDIPRISGLTFLEMRDPYVIPGGAYRVPTITDVTRISMREPTDAALDAVTDYVFSTIEKASAVTCRGEATPADLAEGRILIDCPETEISQRLTVNEATGIRLAGTAKFGADITVTDAVTLIASGSTATTTLRGSRILVSDGVVQGVSLEPVNSIANVLDIDAISAAEFVMLNGVNEYDVTENLMLQNVTLTASANGNDAVVAMPTYCPAGWSPVRDLISIRPPDSYTDPGPPAVTYHSIDGIDSTESGDRFGAVVVYARTLDGSGDAECTQTCTRTYTSGGTLGEETCTSQTDTALCDPRLTGDRISVTTPKDTVFTFRVGCTKN
jgi:hypothetical protein